MALATLMARDKIVEKTKQLATSIILFLDGKSNYGLLGRIPILLISWSFRAAQLHLPTEDREMLESEYYLEFSFANGIKWRKPSRLNVKAFI